MSDNGDVIVDALGDAAHARLRRGVYVGVDEALSALVDLGDSRFPCRFGSGYVPVIGETVQVLSINSRHLMLPVGPKPGRGIVTAIDTPTRTVTVTALGVPTQMPYLGATPALGALVAIQWSSGASCLGTLSTTPEPTPTPPDPGGGGQLRTVEFRAIDTASFNRSNGRWWTGEVWASNVNFGAWFYGAQLKDTIPATAEFVSVEFFVSHQPQRLATPNFVLHSAPDRPAGLPAISDRTPWNPESGWRTPPDAEDWFAQLRAGGPRYGVGVDTGGWTVFSSLAQDSMSGALRISWRQ